MSTGDWLAFVLLSKKGAARRAKNQGSRRGLENISSIDFSNNGLAKAWLTSGALGSGGLRPTWRSMAPPSAMFIATKKVAF